MRLIDADRFAEISKHHIPEVLEDTFDEGYIACLKAVDLTPTVEAIPIEFLESWKKGKTSIEQVVADKIMMDYKYRDWEKINGK